jgi:hypothetical protein
LNDIAAAHLPLKLLDKRCLRTALVALARCHQYFNEISHWIGTAWRNGVGIYGRERHVGVRPVYNVKRPHDGFSLFWVAKRANGKVCPTKLISPRNKVLLGFHRDFVQMLPNKWTADRFSHQVESASRFLRLTPKGCVRK